MMIVLKLEILNVHEFLITYSTKTWHSNAKMRYLECTVEDFSCLI